MSQSIGRVQKTILIIAFLVVPIALLCTLSFYPALKLLELSFTNWDGMSPTYNFIGFKNFVAVFQNSAIFSTFGHNFSYFIGGIVQNIVALYFAVVLNTRIRGQNLFRVLLFLPYILNSVAIAYMFQYVLNDQGALNAVLHALHLGALGQSWLGNASIVNWSLAFVSMWKYMGFNMVIYLGALQAIPTDMYEAGKIDGANAVQTFFSLTLPNIRRILEISLLLTVSGALEVFDIPFVMTNATPQTSTFVTETVQVAYTFNNFGLASAMSIVLLIIVVLVISIQRRLLRIGGEA